MSSENFSKNASENTSELASDINVNSRFVNKLNNRLIAIGTFVLNLFVMCLFISKSALDLFAFLSVLTGLIYWAVNYRSVPNKKYLYGIVFLYTLGILTNYFSLSGIDAVKSHLIESRYILIGIPILIFYPQMKDKNKIFKYAAVGLGFAMLYSVYLYIFKYKFSRIIRIESTWDITRWGVILLYSIIFSSLRLKEKWESLNKRKIFMNIMFIFFMLIFFYFIQIRATWVALFVAISAYLLLLRKKDLYKILVPGATLVLLFYFSSTNFKDRIDSIFNIKINEMGMLTSSDKSNAGRLHMWTMGVRFFNEQPWFGTGIEILKEHYEPWLSTQPIDMQNYFYSSDWSTSDMHNQYLHSLVTQGVIYSVILYAFILYLLCQTYLKYKETNRKHPDFITLSVLLANISFLIFGMFSVELFSYPGYFFWGSFAMTLGNGMQSRA